MSADRPRDREEALARKTPHSDTLHHVTTRHVITPTPEKKKERRKEGKKERVRAGVDLGHFDVEDLVSELEDADLGALGRGAGSESEGEGQAGERERGRVRTEREKDKEREREKGRGKE
eukprot:409438-Rhodomonas_salina.1